MSDICISLSMVAKVQAGSIRRHWIESLQNKSICRVTLMFVPGDGGVSGNKRADKLVDKAAASEGKPMDRADIMNNLREQGHNEDICSHPSSSINRMQDLGLTRRAARK
ncbi:hypothetical protein BsWGS_19454 [Bradybaena similaris]